jgi:hypothetical protein
LVVVWLEACKDRLRRVAPYVLYQACFLIRVAFLVLGGGAAVYVLVEQLPVHLSVPQLVSHQYQKITSVKARHIWL